MLAIVMAGGLGKRLRPLTDHLPKPMIRLAGKPIIERVMDSLSQQGFKRVIVTIGYLGEMIRLHLGPEWKGMEVSYLEEQHPLGTAGCLSLLRHLDEPFVMMNADLLTDYPLQQARQAVCNGASACMVVLQKAVSIRYGQVTFDAEGTLNTMVEKRPYFYYASAGIYGVAPDAMQLIPKGRSKLGYTKEGKRPTFYDGVRMDWPDLIASLKHAGRRIVVRPMPPSCTWYDIGIPEDLKEAEQVARKLYGGLP